jgi:hypothetical protein
MVLKKKNWFNLTYTLSKSAEKIFAYSYVLEHSQLRGIPPLT